MTIQTIPKHTLTHKQANITQGILSGYDNIARIVNGFVSLLTGIVTFAMSEVVIILAPIPAVYSIFRAMVEGLHTPLWVGIAAATALEVMSMFVSKTAIAAFLWNQQRTNKTEPLAPFALAVTMAALFYTVILILSLAIEILPTAAVLIPPGFVLAVIAVYFCFAINTNLTRWEASKAQTLAARETKRGLTAEVKTLTEAAQTLRAEVSQLTNQVDTLTQQKSRLEGQNQPYAPKNGLVIADYLPEAQAARKAKKSTRQEAILKLAANHSQAQIADILRVSVSTVKRDFRELNGQIAVLRGGDK